MKKVLVFWVICLCGMAFGQLSVNIEGGELLLGIPLQVKLPFDSEYSIYLKNLDNYRRALINIRVDGRKVTGDGLILRKGETVTLERFIDSGSLTQGKKFKFIDKVQAIADGREANKEDGLVIVDVQYEKPEKLIEYRRHTVMIPDAFHEYNFNAIPVGSTTIHELQSNLTNVSCSPTSEEYSPGVTEEGSESCQRFQEEKIGELENQKDKITIKLVGYYKTPSILLNK